MSILVVINDCCYLQSHVQWDVDVSLLGMIKDCV